ncbi:SsgA family sporulation/cell division regulator [Actinocrispum sp. NPDC049592]|uniref:SsgA family sporulation/cell division regulator n=1 Tax=Actinocrispum sp. NPDC049592 TaxID=3154835 RepID=UPI0034136C55
MTIRPDDDSVVWLCLTGWVYPHPAHDAVRVDRAAAVPLCRTGLGFDPADPFAIKVQFNNATWLVSREMLTDALRCPAHAPGGDVWLAPDGDELRITLSSPTGAATVWLPRRHVQAVLAQAAERVPLGDEAGRIDWDRLLLLCGGEPT